MKIKRLVISFLSLGLLLVVVMSGGCGQQTQKVDQLTVEDAVIINGKEIKTSMTHNEIKAVLGLPERTVPGYFFNESIATDYYASDNILVRYTIDNKWNNVPTDEVMSILVLGGNTATKNGIKVGDTVEKIFSILGKKEEVGFRSDETLYLDYGIIFYYDPAYNAIKWFTLPSKYGNFD